MADRRRHPRTACDLLVKWQRVESDRAVPGHHVATGPVSKAAARDLSRNGLAFVADAEVEVGATLLLSLERSFVGPPLSALGRVVRCAEETSGFVVGVELTWIECTVPEQALGLQPENAWTLL